MLRQMYTEESKRHYFYEVIWATRLAGGILTQKQIAFENYYIRDHNINKEIYAHYCRTDVVFEIVKALNKRELSVGPNLRGGYCNSLRYFIQRLEQFSFFSNPKSLYKGLTEYSDLKELSRDRVKLNQNASELAISYDFGVDIDCAEGIMAALPEALRVAALFDEFGVGFGIWASGGKGFHLVCPYSEIKDAMSEEAHDYYGMIEYCYALAYMIDKVVKIPNWDYTIYSPARYLKCPWTLYIKKDKPLSVILPLTKEQLANFSLEMIKPENVGNVRNRGWLLHPSTPGGFKAMVEHLEQVSGKTIKEWKIVIEEENKNGTKRKR